MHLKCKKRKKDGKVHRGWSVVESDRLANGRGAKRHLLELGEIDGSQRLAWCKTIEAFEGKTKQSRQVALFPQDRQPPEELADGLPPRAVLEKVATMQMIDMHLAVDARNELVMARYTRHDNVAADRERFGAVDWSRQSRRDRRTGRRGAPRVTRRSARGRAGARCRG